MSDLRTKQSSLLQMIHILWEDPGNACEVGDKYWELRESDYLGTNPDADNYNNLVDLCCRQIVIRQMELHKLEELMRNVL